MPTLLRPHGGLIHKMKILLELRPAFDGHAGIPQETRLLFRALSRLPDVEVDGLLQSPNRVLARGLPADTAALQRMPEHRRIDRQARVVVSALGSGDLRRWAHAWHLVLRTVALCRATLAAAAGRSQTLTRFDPTRFEDFLWRTLFAKTLPVEDLEQVAHARYRVWRMPWAGSHAAALLTRKLGRAIYPRLDTSDYDLLIAETPFPGRVSMGRTRLVIRYHDAIPLLMPHTISSRAYHQASHYEALRSNVRDGAWFACVSKATRDDLVAIFPEVSQRAVAIPNMVSHNYFPEDAAPGRIADILRTRINTDVHKGEVSRTSARFTYDERGLSGSDAPPYLLMVSTIEPRKNHLTLLAAWEQLRATGSTDLQLVLVGMLGWESKAIVAKLAPWLAAGQVRVLGDVPAAELRLLYRHAQATICPSYGEGFGFSGVEAMCCGGVVVASDLPVHREIYDDAAEYFNPYSATELAEVIDRLLRPESAARRTQLVERGAEVAARYTPQVVLPQWQAFLCQVSGQDVNSHSQARP